MASPGNDVRNLRRRRIRDAVNEFKVARGCTVCRFTGHPSALMLLHDGPTSIARMIVNGRSEEEILAAVEKSEVVCANCTAIRRYNEDKDAA